MGRGRDDDRSKLAAGGPCKPRKQAQDACSPSPSSSFSLPSSRSWPTCSLSREHSAARTLQDGGPNGGPGKRKNAGRARHGRARASQRIQTYFEFDSMARQGLAPTRPPIPGTSLATSRPLTAPARRPNRGHTVRFFTSLRTLVTCHGGPTSRASPTVRAHRLFKRIAIRNCNSKKFLLRRRPKSSNPERVSQKLTPEEEQDHRG